MAIGINNNAKIEGIKSFDENAKVRFIAVEDKVTTKMCRSLDGQIFNVLDWNNFKRYSATNDAVRTYKCYGLIVGLNCPPINDHFHFCRSTITYQLPIENSEKVEYNEPKYIRKNKFTDSKKLDESIKKALKLLPEKFVKMVEEAKVIKINKGDSRYDRNNDTIYLLEDSDKYEVLHEIGYMIETKLNLLKDTEYINIQRKGLDVSNVHIDGIKGFDKKYQFWLDGNKFVSEQQRLIYDNDIEGNGIINFAKGEFNPKVLGEYFAEGFSYYFKPKRKIKGKRHRFI